MQYKIIKALALGTLAVLLSATLVIAKDKLDPAAQTLAEKELYLESDSLNLVFIFNKCYGAFTHVSAVLNADSKLIYDPGGSWMKQGPLPERGFFDDVSIEDLVDFINYHRNPNHMIIIYPIPLTKEELNHIYIYRYNAPLEEPGVCALRISALIKEIPRFSGINISLFPRDIFNFINWELGDNFSTIFIHPQTDNNLIFNSSKWNDFFANIYGQKFSWMNVKCIE